MKEETIKSGRVPAVRQALQVLRYLSGTGGAVSVSTVSRETGLSASTCFNLLRTLAEEGVVALDPDAKTYQLGFGLLELASRLINRDDAVLVRPLLERIAMQYHALITLWRLNSNERMALIDRVYGDSEVRIEMRLGARVPIFAGAIGRSVVAATRPPLADLRRSFDLLHWQTPLRFDEFMTDVEQASQDGFGLDIDHWTRGVHAVGTVVLDRSSSPKLAIGGLAIAGQLSIEELRKLGAELRDAARLIGRALYGAAQPAAPSISEPSSV
jgi:DNA-binding IclR family transcriptional regulator